MAKIGLHITFPVSVSTVNLFVAYLSKQNLAPSTISTYLAGIAFFHKLHGYEDPTNSFITTKMLEGIRRFRPQADSRLPITADILKSLPTALSKICRDTYETLLFTSAYLVAFYGMLRVGELALTSGDQPDRPLQISDLSFLPEDMGLSLSLRKSKCNQRGKPQIIKIFPAKDHTLCPIIATKRFLTVRARSTYLFCHMNGLPITRYQFCAVLNKCLSSLGIQAKYHSHSFRIGAASYLADTGVSASTIKSLGSWKSDAFKRYIR